jgi:Phosphotransferase enzyme family
VTSNLLIREPAEITAAWLSKALDRPGLEVTDVRRIGTGQMSLTFRVSFRDAGGADSVVVKLASDNATSRATGVGMGAYFREVEFYRHLSDRIGGPLPRCDLAEYDPAEGWFTLILADVPGAEQGDQIGGCDVASAATVMRALAQLHAPVFNDLAVGTMEFLNLPNPINGDLMSALLPAFFDRYGDQVSDENRDVCRRYVAAADAHASDRRAPLGLVHGDFRLDNLLFDHSGCVVVDWQTVQWGPVMLDAAYFLGGSLDIEERRAHEEELVRVYYDGLLADGVSNFGWDQCKNEYRRQVFWALAMVIVPAMVVERTERGDEMFMTLLKRVCQQILDLGSLELLPRPGQAPAALRPAPEAEAPHEPGSEPFWNESWYFDAVSRDPGIGVYVRLGNVPNQVGGVYSIAVVRPGQPTVMVTDYACPHPVLECDRQTINAVDYRATQHCVTPLREYHVQFDGSAAQLDDDAAPLRGEAGAPVQLSLDLRWRTDGEPYAWRASTRYEIPCHVEGTVSIDGQTIHLSGPGQRDHSWGTRDWWANDWMWTAFHLQDGTRVHAVTAPNLPGYAIGYIQKDGRVTELKQGASSAEPTADGLVTSARLTFGEGDDELVVEVEPRGFGALRMAAPDGRVAHFPRALADFRTADGRCGVGWIEWNINQRDDHGPQAEAGAPQLATAP